MSIDHGKAGINLEEYRAVRFDCRHPEAAVYLAQQCVDMGIPRGRPSLFPMETIPHLR